MSGRKRSGSARETEGQKEEGAGTHIVNVDELVLGTRDVGDVHVVGRRRNVFELLLGEDLRGRAVYASDPLLSVCLPRPPSPTSVAIRWTLACPCLPVLEVDMSMTLHGRPLMTTCPPLRSAEHCMG